MIIFKVGEFYMHKKAMDVCIEVMRNDPVYGAQRLTVFFWCLGYTGKPWLADKQGSVITIRDYMSEDWVYVSPDALITPRLKSGPPC